MRACAWSAMRLGGEAAVVVACSVLLLVWLYDLPGRDLSVPMHHGGDALENAVQVKMLVERGWPLSHSGMGAPHGLTMHDYQRAATLQFVLLWVISLFTSDVFLLTNLYLLLTFPLVALGALWSLRALGVRFWLACSVSLLFAFLSYHHFRGTSHLFLSGYFLVPASALLVIWTHLDLPLFRREGDKPTRLRLPRRGWVAPGACGPDRKHRDLLRVLRLPAVARCGCRRRRPQSHRSEVRSIGRPVFGRGRFCGREPESAIARPVHVRVEPGGGPALRVGCAALRSPRPADALAHHRSPGAGAGEAEERIQPPTVPDERK